MKIKLIVSAVVLLAVTTACLAAKPRPARTLSRLPTAVQQTVQAQLGDGKLSSVEENEDGTYDAEMVRDGKTRDFTVGANGELIDRQVFLSELPPTVQQAIQTQTGNGTTGDIYKTTDDGETSYDAEITRDGKERDFTFADDGRLLSEEMFLTELSPAARQTIQKTAAGATIDEIDESFEDASINYDVETTRDGRSRDFDVATNGDLLDEQVFPDELPGALLAAIRKEAAGATIGDIYQSVDEDGTNYDVDLTTGDATRTVTFEPDGAIASQEQPVHLADVSAAVQKTIQSLEGKVLGIARITEDSDISYDVDLVTAGKPKTVSIGEDGKILPDDN